MCYLRRSHGFPAIPREWRRFLVAAIALYQRSRAFQTHEPLRTHSNRLKRRTTMHKGGGNNKGGGGKKQNKGGGGRGDSAEYGKKIFHAAMQEDARVETITYSDAGCRRARSAP